MSDWWWGTGDYEIVSNSLIVGGTKAAMQPMAISNQRNGGEVRIKFREYLGDVRTHPTTVGAWYNTSYTLNAANTTTFPWFSAIANQYEQWSPNGIIFEFRSTATDYSTSQNLGSIVMATDYDYADADYGSKMEALNSAYSAESKLSTDVQWHGIECAPSSNPMRIFYCNSSTTVPAGTSKHEYFLGKFQIATVGSAAAANSIVGSLYVNYDMTLRKPQYIQGLLGKEILFDMYILQGTFINQTSPLGTSAPIKSADSNLGTTVVLNTVSFPPNLAAGLFRVTWGGRRDSGITGGQTGPGLTLVNCSEVTPPDGLPYYQTFKNGIWAVGYGIKGDYAGSTLIKIDTPGATMQFTNTGGANFVFEDAFLNIEQVNSLEA